MSDSVTFLVRSTLWPRKYIPWRVTALNPIKNRPFFWRTWRDKAIGLIYYGSSSSLPPSWSFRPRCFPSFVVFSLAFLLSFRFAVTQPSRPSLWRLTIRIFVQVVQSVRPSRKIKIDIIKYSNALLRRTVWADTYCSTCGLSSWMRSKWLENGRSATVHTSKIPAWCSLANWNITVLFLA